MIELMTVSEAAAALRVKETTICTWAKNGKIHALKVGRQWRIRRDAVLKMLGTTASEPQPAADGCKYFLDEPATAQAN